MPAYKDKATGKWMARFYASTYTGERKQIKKRGFERKRDALEYERMYLDKLEGDADMTMQSLWENYKEDKQPLLKPTTWISKEYMFKDKILPYFKDDKISQITPKDIVKWQNEMISKGYTPTYLKTIHNQLSAIFNHAIRYYGLKSNPARIAGSMGEKNAPKRDIWTLDDFNDAIYYYEKLKKHNQINNRMYIAIFTILFFTGLRIGELMALTKDDFNYADRTVSISKNLQVLNGNRMIMEPKTKASVRTVNVPDIVLRRLDEYIETLYKYKSNELLFNVDKYKVNRQLRTIHEKIDLPKISAHDLRHSHASLLIKQGVQAKVIQERLGHQNIETTLNTYSHLWETADKEVADLLNELSPN